MVTYLVAPDNEGREFIFAFGSNSDNAGGTLEVFITTRQTGPVAFNYTSGGQTIVSRNKCPYFHILPNYIGAFP